MCQFKFFRRVPAIWCSHSTTLFLFPVGHVAGTTHSFSAYQFIHNLHLPIIRSSLRDIMPSSDSTTPSHPPAVENLSVDEEPGRATRTSSSASSMMSQDERTSSERAGRPRMGSRKSSGSIIVSRESVHVELHEEAYDIDDARAMSPRRSSEEIEKISEDAREALIGQAKALQASLLDIADRVETVKSEHEKLEGGNKFLQSYIGELMQTSKIISTGTGRSKGKNRAAK